MRICDLLQNFFAVQICSTMSFRTLQAAVTCAKMEHRKKHAFATYLKPCSTTNHSEMQDHYGGKFLVMKNKFLALA